VCALNPEEETVRLVGVDTPESTPEIEPFSNLPSFFKERLAICYCES
jgi:hypothetical protein